VPVAQYGLLRFLATLGNAAKVRCEQMPAPLLDVDKFLHFYLAIATKSLSDEEPQLQKPPTKDRHQGAQLRE
jgi:hypothetical protein